MHLEMDKENVLPTITPLAKKPYTPCRDPKQKLGTIFHALAEVNWTLSEFLYQTFQIKNDDGAEIHHMDQHAKYAQHLLQGTGRYTAGMMLEC